jgi:hypothetical protein
MQRITTATRFIDKFGPGKDGFNDGNDTTGVSSTQLEANWFDNAQEEIANAIELAGIPLDPTDMTQLWQAIGAVATGATAGYVLKTGDVMSGPGNLTVNGLFAAGATIGTYPAITVSASGNVLMNAPEPTGPFPFPLLFAPFSSSQIHSLNSYIVGSGTYRYWTGDPIMSFGYDAANLEYQFTTSDAGAPGAIATNISTVLSFRMDSRNVRVLNQLEIIGSGVIYNNFSPFPIGLAWTGVGLDLYVDGARQGSFMLGAVADDADLPRAIQLLADRVKALEGSATAHA